MNKLNTKETIVKETINLLKEEGSSGITMRKIAARCSITLSNLQYHYPDKSILLQTVAQYFCKKCEENIEEELKALTPKNKTEEKQFIKKLLEILLKYDDTSLESFVFREIWALSMRDEQLKSSLQKYYEDYNNKLINIVAVIKNSPEEIVSLLTPYAEGYSIIGKSIPLTKNKTIEMLEKIIQNFE
ncbi:TetR/AcrR family transcriptional regulator [Flavobacterium pectinovorum]|uniref:TetR/AcrR family transcriptional regulator n=1 Tax=Flavobacterium pectinovorum TaxID=29533 RepID=A0A502EMP7_9FLAO|nr:TetR/AcrR family transcriptional regulator [Flavobacterium pectinovorum]TPG37766.1 TetR/AcrR family transcriptional regulator [Flavobacterium pectinovorum]